MNRKQIREALPDPPPYPDTALSLRCRIRELIEGAEPSMQKWYINFARTRGDIHFLETWNQAEVGETPRTK